MIARKEKLLADLACLYDLERIFNPLTTDNGPRTTYVYIVRRPLSATSNTTLG